MATKLGSLLIELGLDSAKFRSGTRQAQREMSQFQRNVSGAADMAKGAIVGMVSALSVDMFAQVIKSSLDYAASMGEVAAQVGVSAKSLQEYRYAATQVNMTQQEMDASLARLTRTMGQAVSGGKEQSDTFARLGIDIRAFVASGRDAGDLMPEIAEGMKRLGSDAERASTLNQLFGRSGQKLAVLLGEGAEGVNNLRDAAHRLGIVLSDKQIQDADITADKLAAVQTVLQARIAGVVADNSLAIIEFANSLATFTGAAMQATSAWLNFTRAQGDEGQVGRFMSAARFVSPAAMLYRTVRGGVRNTWGDSGGQTETGRENVAGFGTLADWRAMTASSDARRAARVSAPPVSVGGGGGGRAGGAADNEAQRAIEDRRRALADLLDELNPVVAKQREFSENTELLNRALRDGQLSAEQHTLAIAQLRREYGVAGEGVTDWREVIGDVAAGVDDDMREVAGVLEETYGNLADHWEDQAQRMQDAAEKQRQALYDTLGSIRNFANSLKSGDILGVVEGVLGILEGIGGMTGGFNIGGMRFGTGAASRIPRFAGGTGFAPGGLAWVGERGAELVNLPRGASVTPNHALKGLSGSQVQIVPSPYFDVVVDGRVMNAAPGIAAAGSQGAQMAMARRGTRRLA